MDKPYSDPKLAAIIISLLKKYEENFYAEPNDKREGVREGDLLFMINKQENDGQKPPSNTQQKKK